MRPGVAASRKREPCGPAASRRRYGWAAMARPAPPGAKALRSVDLPELGRPIIVTIPVFMN